MIADQKVGGTRTGTGIDQSAGVVESVQPKLHSL